MANKDLNRIKVVLAEQKRTAKWLAEPAYGKVRLDGYKSKGFKNTEVGMMQQLLTGKIKLV